MVCYEESLGRSGEAPVGIEPTSRGFADLCLTTWLRRQVMQGLNLPDQRPPVNPRTVPQLCHCTASPPPQRDRRGSVAPATNAKSTAALITFSRAPATTTMTRTMDRMTAVNSDTITIQAI